AADVGESQPANVWRPRRARDRRLPAVPIRTFLHKVASRCNIDCSYCYVYHMADQSWKQRPALMAPKTIQAAATQVRAHALRHGLSEVTIVLHGGEPLLAGQEFFARFTAAYKA